jgi:thiamine pyrophosphokinase
MKAVLILCNGNPPTKKLFRKYRAKSDYFIAADGGANIAFEMGSNPDVVIGDLDSYESTENEPFEIIFRPSQEMNELKSTTSCT